MSYALFCFKCRDKYGTKKINQISYITLVGLTNNVKKMCSRPRKQFNYSEFEKYRLPIYSKRGKDKYVYWYVLDPQSILDGAPRLKRMRKKFNDYPTARLRDEAATRFILELSSKLKTGWNPLFEENPQKAFTPILNALELYQHHLTKQHKDKILKDKTKVDYESRLNTLRQYVSTKASITYTYQFNQAFIESFLDYIYYDRDNSPRTRNNYLNWLGSFSAWMVGRNLVKDTGIEHIKKLPEYDKKRKPLEKSDMKVLHDYLSVQNPSFLLACQVHYYSLVRPGELSWIKISDICLKDQTMFISRDISKNRKDAKVTLPIKVLNNMIDMGYFNYPSHYYLFGHDFRPAEQHADARIFRDEWAKIRKALNWPDCYQFYSLKDTGITDTIDKVGLTVAKDQARHSDISTTNQYVRKEQLRAHPELMNFDGDL